ncbi:MAG: hypothetical protein JWQ40_2286 [Segetibacter sp.]|nr:hypothetical protein [Segetibacter sp.]
MLAGLKCCVDPAGTSVRRNGRWNRITEAGYQKKLSEVNRLLQDYQGPVLSPGREK